MLLYSKFKSFERKLKTCQTNAETQTEQDQNKAGSGFDKHLYWQLTCDGWTKMVSLDLLCSVNMQEDIFFLSAWLF